MSGAAINIQCLGITNNTAIEGEISRMAPSNEALCLLLQFSFQVVMGRGEICTAYVQWFAELCKAERSFVLGTAPVT